MHGVDLYMQSHFDDWIVDIGSWRPGPIDEGEWRVPYFCHQAEATEEAQRHRLDSSLATEVAKQLPNPHFGRNLQNQHALYHVSQSRHCVFCHQAEPVEKAERQLPSSCPTQIVVGDCSHCALLHESQGGRCVFCHQAEPVEEAQRYHTGSSLAMEVAKQLPNPHFGWQSESECIVLCVLKLALCFLLDGRSS